MGSLPVFTANSALSWAWNQFQKRPSDFCPQSEEARSKLAGSRARVVGARIMKVLSAPPNGVRLRCGAQGGESRMDSTMTARRRQLQARVRRQAFARGPIRSWTTRAAPKNARAAPSEISALRPYLEAVPRSLRKIRALE